MFKVEDYIAPIQMVERLAIGLIYTYWSSKREGREFPSRRDLDPADMVAHLDEIALLDIEDDISRSRFRVYGSGLAARTGKDYTGKTIADVQPTLFSEALQRQFSDVIIGQQPVLHSISIDTGLQEHYFARLSLPLSDDGIKINKVLTASTTITCPLLTGTSLRPWEVALPIDWSAVATDRRP